MSTNATGVDKLVPKLRKIVESVAKEIAKKSGPRETNTPKRALQGMVNNIEIGHLSRIKSAAEKLADARESGTLPASLEHVNSKKIIAELLATRWEHRSHYVVFDTGEYHAKTEAAIEFRNWVDGRKTETELKLEAKRKQKQAIAELEAKIRFTNIAGFFPTPPNVCERMLDVAQLESGHVVLEPSAGKGDLVDAILATSANVRVECYEISYSLREILKAKGHVLVGDDFLDGTPLPIYDRVLMNPPFENGRDIEHVLRAFELLKPGGRLVAIMSTGPMYRNDGKAVAFRDWLHARGGECENLPEGSFKDGFVSTGVNACMVTVDKA